MSDVNPFEALQNRNAERQRKRAKMNIWINVGFLGFYVLMFMFYAWLISAGLSESYWTLWLYGGFIVAFVFIVRLHWKTYIRWDDVLREPERRESNLSGDDGATPR